MATREEITELLNERVLWPRMVSEHPGWSQPFHVEARPSVEDLADEWLGIAECKALQLGTWLGTTDGEVITQAVEMMSPPLYRQDEELLVDALKLAAQRQAQEGQQRAGRFALGAIGVAALVAVGFGETLGRQAA